MTKIQFRKKFRQVLNDSVKEMKRKAESAMVCGAIDMGDYEDDFELPKIVLHAVIDSLREDLITLKDDAKSTAENLALFI